MFANRPRGAQDSTIIYNLVEIAKDKRLDSFKYLVHVLDTGKKVDLSQKDNVDLLLPENSLVKCLVVEAYNLYFMATQFYQGRNLNSLYFLI